MLLVVFLAVFACQSYHESKKENKLENIPHHEMQTNQDLRLKFAQSPLNGLDILFFPYTPPFHSHALPPRLPVVYLQQAENIRQLLRQIMASSS